MRLHVVEIEKNEYYSKVGSPFKVTSKGDALSAIVAERVTHSSYKARVS